MLCDMSGVWGLKGDIGGRRVISSLRATLRGFWILWLESDSMVEEVFVALESFKKIKAEATKKNLKYFNTK